ncbi:MAG: ABC transporter substrate-binding protein [Deltaproteobacteria bacterium]|nr:MAG: ABC transporter substrate-binding protein [Deltaproteobacteria bacterium]
MRKIVFPILVLFAVFPFRPGTGHASRIVVVLSDKLSPYQENLEGFRNTCEATITEYDMRGDEQWGEEIIRKIQASSPDLVLAIGTQAATLISEKLDRIPIIFSMVLNPEKHGLTGPNITGISLDIPVKTQLQTMRDMLPGIKKIGVLFDPKESGKIVSNARKVAEEMGFELIAVKTSSPKEIPRSLRETLSQVDALWMVADKTVVTNQSIKFFLETSLNFSVPLYGLSDSYVRSGALVSLTVDYRKNGEQMGALANRILGGTDPSLLPIMPPQNIYRSLNTRVASELNLKIPTEILKATKNVYE